MRAAAFILMLLSWPVTLVHRLMNNSPVDVVNWFVFVSEPQDKQYYVYMTGLMVSVLFMLLSMILFILSKSKSGTSDYVHLLIALVIIQLIEVANYWLYYGQNDGFVYIQGGTLLLIVIKNISTYSNGTKPKGKYHESII